MRTIYLESAIREHPRAQRIIERLAGRKSDVDVIEIDRYAEVFNHRRQSFRLGKRRPAWILAEKHDALVLDSPEICGIPGSRNYYFSHMLNCPYDCRYCFLQGMYQAAHYLLFVNFEDFADAIENKAAESSAASFFFSGYDCDSLALDAVTAFADYFIERLRPIDNAWLELRTKSVRIGALLEREPQERTVVAFSLSPEVVAQSLEHGTPPVATRIRAIERLAEHGWLVGLRFDPVIDHERAEEHYRELIDDVFGRVRTDRVHSVSIGALRFPRDNFKAITRLYPDEPLFAGGLVRHEDRVTYDVQREDALLHAVKERVAKHIGMDRVLAVDE